MLMDMIVDYVAPSRRHEPKGPDVVEVIHGMGEPLAEAEALFDPMECRERIERLQDVVRRCDEEIIKTYQTYRTTTDELNAERDGALRELTEQQDEWEAFSEPLMRYRDATPSQESGSYKVLVDEAHND